MSSLKPLPDFPVYEVLRRIGANNGFYNAMRILPHLSDTMVCWIPGMRRIGKTDLFLHAACMLYQEYGLKTMWLRNKEVELQEPGFLADFLNDAHRFGWCPEDWVAKSDGVHVSKDKDSDIAIKFQAISTFSNRRGGAHPDVEMMVFDEFCPEDRRYPKMCAVGLLSLTKTVFSGRETARLFCLSNFTEATNPYFVKLRIFPKKERDVTLFPEKRMLIERCNGYRCAIAEGNPWNDVYRAAGVGDYASEDEDSMLKMVKRMPKGLRPAPFAVIIDGLAYRIYSGERYNWWSEYRGSLKGLYCITPNVTECTDTVQLMPKYMFRNINADMEAGVLRFDHPNVMFAVLNMVYDAV